MTDRVAMRRGVNKGRQIVGMTGMGLAAGSIALGPPQNLRISPSRVCHWVPVGCTSQSVHIGLSISDLSPTHAGSLSGLMNMGANLGGAISPTLTPMDCPALGVGGSLGLAAFIALLGGILWLRIKPGDGLKQ